MTMIEALGLSDPVFGSQTVFRILLSAISSPGTNCTLPEGISGHPDTISPAAAALILTLCDFETPIYLSEPSYPLEEWIRFYTGAKRVADPIEANFALIRNHDVQPALSDFYIGDDRYPDQSTTVIIECPSLIGGTRVSLSGPGIKTQIEIAPFGLRENFWAEMQANNCRFPLGVDVIFASGHDVIALPRSVQIAEII